MDDEYQIQENNDSSYAKEPTCPRCGLRSYEEICSSCNTPILDKKDDEEEEYDWREHKR